MNFIDSNVLILASYENEKQLSCQQAIREGGVINALVLAETLTVLERIIDRKVAQTAIASFLRSDLEIADLDVSVIFDALKQSKRMNLHFFDLIHYTTALARECSAIVSLDKDFENLELPRIEPRTAVRNAGAPPILSDGVAEHVHPSSQGISNRTETLQ